MSYEIEFPEAYFEEYEQITPARGCLDVQVAFSDGSRHQVSFYDLVRLKQTLDQYAERGQVHFADENMVVLTEVNTANIRKAVAALVEQKFFGAKK